VSNGRFVIDLHILQSFPFNNINRGEDGAPKSCIYGGIERARFSSQAKKYATRKDLQTRDAEGFTAVRTKSICERLHQGLLAKNIADPEAAELAQKIATNLSTMENEKTKVVLYISRGEIQAIVDVVAAETNPKARAKVVEKKVSSILKKTTVKDETEIGVMGRMVAEDTDLDVESILSVAHGFSIHQARPEVDFFTCEDEDATNNGSGHPDEALYSASTCYLCVSIDLALVAKNLTCLSPEDRKVKIEQVIRSLLKAVPIGKKHSAFANTYPGRVLGVVRKDVNGLSMADAFENPVQAPYLQNGLDRLQTHWGNLKKTLGSELGVVKEVLFSVDPTVANSVDLDTFCKALTGYVA